MDKRHYVDLHVGEKIRQRRHILGLSQQALAEGAGIKFQQIQKYESGTNRVSASRLWVIAQILDVPVSYFFDGLRKTEGLACGNDCEVPADILTDKRALDLVRTYYSIPEKHRHRLVDLARILT